MFWSKLKLIYIFYKAIICDQSSVKALKNPKLLQSMSKRKDMVIVFFNVNGVVLENWVPEGATVKQHCYKQVLPDVAPCDFFSLPQNQICAQRNVFCIIYRRSK